MYLILDGVTPDKLALPSPMNFDVRIVVNPRPTGGHWGKVLQMQITTMRDALNEADVSADALLYRIDSDGVVVRPGLTNRAHDLFATRPKLGQIGQCFTNIVGGRMSNFGWENFFRISYGWRGLVHFLTRKVPNTTYSITARIEAWRNHRVILDHARDSGYMWGEFGLGPYILRGSVINTLDRMGWVDTNPFLFLPKLGDDVAMTLLGLYAVSSGT